MTRASSNPWSMRWICFLLMPAVLTALACAPARCAEPARPTDIDGYIRHAWDTLQRSVASPEAYKDTKVGAVPRLYLPHGMATPPEIVRLQEECKVTVTHLPRAIRHLGDVKPADLAAHGLLYLPHPYVVPGGMFNEMYGWDSYFIIRGLLADGKVERARGMCENWFFEIEHYGAILNANRTYYLTRSQPPFLTSAVRAIHEQTRDRAWLTRAYGFAVRDHALWTTAPHLAGDTGLSRYYDVGDGPIPEMGAHEDYYQVVASHVLAHPGSADYVQAGEGTPAFTLQVKHGASASPPVPIHLTADYFKGDRAMRASGFDVSFRFGPFSGATHHFAPVCLNSLLYKAERDLADIARVLGKPEDVTRWEEAARTRAESMRRHLWDEGQGMFFDYDFKHQRRSTYRYATTFYPLWAGLATPAEARRVAGVLPRFEQAHGIAMSDVASGAQWDLPFGWAPVHLLAVEGLLRYDERTDALRIARKFNAMVRANYERDRTIREKYDVVAGTTQARITVGYAENVVGFGWTNAVYRVFESLLR